MYEENANPRMFSANEDIGIALAGVYPDCRALKDYACNELAEYVHVFTLGISRPFGASAFFTSWNEKDGGKLFLVEPSGLCYEYKAWAVGKHRQAAKAEIEKLKLEEYDMKDLVKEAARIIMAIRDENKDKDVQIELGWVGEHTEGKHQTVPADVVSAAEEWAHAKLDEDDMDE
ncbi:peptidase, T1 family [Teladorsagia circumcincta]|uniref:Peptidase, T1 family n=1 Tax=Teladorsagia circumcincta TaxID=45464 RepID=A0A2G9UVS4_TELCI|nr:peptidase, T1 family [Teladorsagia circumcincta]